jgi:hypothetical protein
MLTRAMPAPAGAGQAFVEASGPQFHRANQFTEEMR